MTSRDGAGEAEEELTRALARLGRLIAESKDKKPGKAGQVVQFPLFP